MQWPLLADLPPDEVHAVLKIARRRGFARNEVVFHRDDPGDSLHLIQKGRFAIRMMTPLGETATIAVRGPGESFGELALVTETDRRSATVLALEEAETFAVYREAFDSLRTRYPGVNTVLITVLANEVRVQSERLLEALYVPVERRVLRRLVELTGLYPPRREDHPLIPLTQEMIAEMAGTSRATANRVLNEEERRGTVALERGKTRIIDLEELRRRARY
jgi:CRP-like cAMP-binding protein